MYSVNGIPAAQVLSQYRGGCFWWFNSPSLFLITEIELPCSSAERRPLPFMTLMIRLPSLTASVAQLVERLPSTQNVVGSNPT